MKHVIVHYHESTPQRVLRYHPPFMHRTDAEEWHRTVLKGLGYVLVGIDAVPEDETEPSG